MSKILDRYAGAVRSSNLRSSSDSTYSDSDVLGAVGLAGKQNPLAMALARLFCGDNHAARDLVQILSELAWGKALALRIDLKRTQADDMARAVLAWHRDGVCKVCGGHGFRLIVGAPALSENACESCKFGKIPFEPNFHAEQRVVAWWLVGQVEREQSIAGPAAMTKLAPVLDRAV